MVRRIIGFSTFLANLDGHKTIYLEAKTREQMNAGNRRATRTKTLDGGAVTYDAGYSPSDLTWQISAPDQDGSIAAYFAMLVKLYPLIGISTADGFFSAVPSRWRAEDGLATIEALVMEQLA